MGKATGDFSETSHECLALSEFRRVNTARTETVFTALVNLCARPKRVTVSIQVLAILMAKLSVFLARNSNAAPLASWSNCML
jgi:hypothetical protein